MIAPPGPPKGSRVWRRAGSPLRLLPLIWHGCRSSSPNAKVGVVSHNLKDGALSRWSTPLAELFEDNPAIRAEYEDQRTVDLARRECHEIEGGYRPITVEQARAILSILGAK